MSSVTTKLSSAANFASSEAQALVAEMRKALGNMKSLAVDYERDGKSDKVQKLEEMVLEMVASYEDCTALTQAIKAVPEVYQPSDQNVHHAGQPMPGEEQEDIVMTSTQMSILNVTCPLTGKPVIELADPVRCVDCRHIYEKGPVFHYIRSQKPPQCPIAGCPRVLQIGKVVCDPLLLIEIDELRSSGPAAPNATNIDDFTDLLDEDDE
ncbi:E3 SUMO-protein ligase MMS21 isoform X2 [Setaria italica]|uniref:E3 SUMO-protein ligase MMS21 isoform X2 n=1 Tax=Setaria italica TaxID=4555 RepID=UPI000350F051|nr:E3 SUMO-protein ligase MMS21 isoform X2 [Setaria italica]